MDTATETEARLLLRELDGWSRNDLVGKARTLQKAGHGRNISYSRKVFIPLTRLCRDVCSYCTFAVTPSRAGAAFMSPEDVLAVARAGERAGCHEALLTLGDKPELRYREAREALDRLGFRTTVDYLASVCALILRETTLLPHVNAGVMTDDELAALRKVSVSQGLMLESASVRLCERGGPHYGSPDKVPARRLETIEAAGKLQIPFTSGILIGIGETRQERIEALIALRDLHRRYGHLQEIIIQNFRAKSDTRMKHAPEPDLDDLIWTGAVARIILGSDANIQIPPNLSFDNFPKLLDAGINDWGGISPVTLDHVNPEAPWPDIKKLADETSMAGFSLTARLAIYPAYAHDPDRWLDPALKKCVFNAADAEGFAREDAWSPGLADAPIPPRASASAISGDASSGISPILTRAQRGDRLNESDIVSLFAARDSAVEEVCAAADDLRKRECGDVVRYVVNRNINYTNVCSYRCGFCAFSKGKVSELDRGRPYDLALEEVARRTREAWDRGATEVCMQGGINPHYTGETYLALLQAVKAEVPQMHVHAFSALEVTQGAATLGLPIRVYLERLRAAGLGSMPGTAAEILDDEVRAVICPDKLSEREWLDVIRTAHEIGLTTTATIMFGHVERPVHWARHLLAVRDLQQQTGGFSEFVPLPFVHMEAPLYGRGSARRGPTWREVRLMHAISRLALHPFINNIQTSWVKLGLDGVAEILKGGANDLGGTLMNESISRSAGTQHGQEFEPAAMEAFIRTNGREPQQRTTLYEEAPVERRNASLQAAPIAPVVLTPFRGKRDAAPANQLTH